MKIDSITIPSPKNRLVFLSGDVDHDTVSMCIEAIVEINEMDDVIGKQAALNNLAYTPAPIKLYIDTFGGDIYACLGLVGVMEASKTPVHTYFTGSAMSAGFIIFVSGHRRFCFKYSTLMYHQLSADAFGEARKLEQDVKENTRIMEMMEEIVTSKTKISKKKLKQVYNSKEDWYISPTEALKLGIVDEIVPPGYNPLI